MNHIDLFSGIGGFAYAAQIVWGEEYNNILFCDNNRFCQEVIKKNFGRESLIYGDIREVTKERVIADTRIQEQRRLSGNERKAISTIRESDLLTAGVPCQPASCAGKRKGTADDRWLWPETFRAIQDFQPAWCVLENVRGLLTLEKGLVFESLLSEMESIGYEVQPFIIPACAVNAPHRRDRVWIVANSEGWKPWKQTEQEGWEDISRRNSHAPRTECPRWTYRIPRQEQEGWAEKRGNGFKGYDWDKNWLEVATELCGVDDGLPAELDGFKLTKAGHRVERLKALGNAIVPRVAVEIFKGIRESEESK